MIKSITALASVLLLTLQLTGCVGGGGATGSGGGTTDATGTPTITLAMADPVTSASKTFVSSGDGAIISATVKNSAGLPLETALVKFELADAALASMTPQSGTALTDSAGVARIRVDAASLLAAGATTLTATSSVQDGSTDVTATAKINFAVGAASVTLTNLSANLSAGATSLTAYATTNVTVSVGGVPTTSSVAVSFTSTCAASGKANLTATANSVNGVATATYVDGGCNGTDTITASVAGTATTISTPLTVNAPSAAAIQFVSAAPTSIVLRGTGAAGLAESSLIKFKLVDNNNLPIPNAQVSFDLTTRAGGILLDGLATGTPTKQTDGSGEVTVSVSAGTVPTPVWVTATHVSGGNTFRTQSVKIQISTGRPVQDRFSLSIKTLNIEGLNIDGTTTDIRVIASDRVGNPVPDGTAINFISSGAQVGTSSLGICSTVNGTCSVTATSANPRPTSGRVAITAYAVGEESFRDDNGDNARQTTEPFQDLGDLFVDANFNTTRDSGEQQVNFATSGLTACGASSLTNYIPPGTTSQLMVAATCDGLWGAAHVRAQSTLILSGSTARLLSPATLSMGNSCRATLAISLDDGNGNILPAGTTIAVSADSKVSRIEDIAVSPPVAVVGTITLSPGTVPNAVASSSSHLLTVAFDKSNCGAPMGAASGGATLLVKTPSGRETAISISVN